MATEKKIIKVESSESAKKASKKKGFDFDDVKDFVVDNKDTIMKVVEVAGTVIAAKAAKDAVTGSKKKTASKKTTKKTTTKKKNDDPLSAIGDIASKFLG